MPNESCAMLFGRVDGDNVIVSDVLLTENITKSPCRFAISNEQLILAYEKAKAEKTDVVGIFHSHPDSQAYPSETDKVFMDCNPVVWVIYSGTLMELRAFVLDGKIKEIPVQ